MFELLKQRHLSDGGAWNPLLLALQADLLHGHHLPRSLVSALIHHPIGTWKNKADVSHTQASHRIVQHSQQSEPLGAEELVHLQQLMLNISITPICLKLHNKKNTILGFIKRFLFLKGIEDDLLFRGGPSK